LRKWLKKVLDWQLPILVTRCEKRSKNFLKLAVFGIQVAALLIENAESGQRAAYSVQDKPQTATTEEKGGKRLCEFRKWGGNV